MGRNHVDAGVRNLPRRSPRWGIFTWLTLGSFHRAANEVETGKAVPHLNGGTEISEGLPGTAVRIAQHGASTHPTNHGVGHFADQSSWSPAIHDHEATP